MSEKIRLTVKQQKFADAYIESGNATEAALKAGYAKNSARNIGSENLTKPYIKEYIDKRLKEIQDKSIAKQEEILQTLTEIMRDRGLEDTRNVLKAAELLGKRYSLWDGKQEEEKGTRVVIAENSDEMQKWMDENESD